jgi:epoxide hydrolase-like predicted phosphatase
LTSQLLPFFDYFVQSAVLGIRKPDPAIFRYTLRLLGCQAEEVVFLDDIGSNLKVASQLGIRCIRVRIGIEKEAVQELERVVGFKLQDDKAQL